MESSLRTEVMKRLLVVLLLVISGNSYAEWTWFSGDDEIVIYVDRATIRRNGNFVKMWGLYDLKTVQNYSGDSYLSSKTQTEYDCKGEKIRLVELFFYSGEMGKGKVVYSSSEADMKWRSFPPQSFAEGQWKIACGKK